MKTLKKYDKDLVSEGIREVERLDKLIEGLIDLSSIHRDNHISVLNVAHEIQEILKDFERKISSKKIKIYTKFKSETFLKVNKEYLYIVISNLLSNAIRYSKEKGKITILLHKNKLIIKDE
jgi:two-component system sensor histidine kinase BaeS